MAEHDHVWRLKADYAQLIAANAKLDAQFRALEGGADDAEKALGRVEKTTKKTGEGFAGAEKVAKVFGGTLGGTADNAADLAEGLEKMGLGSVAIGATAAAAAFAGLAAGAKAVADAAVAARDRLVEQGRAAELPPGASESLDRYRAAAAEASAQIDLLTVAIGADLAEGLSVVVFEGNRALTWIRDMKAEAADATSWTGDLAQGFGLVTRATQLVVSLGMSEVLRSWAAGAQEAADNTNNLAVATERAAEIEKKILEYEAAEDERRGREEATRQKRAGEEAARQAEQTAQAEQRTWDAFYAAMYSAEQDAAAKRVALDKTLADNAIKESERQLAAQVEDIQALVAATLAANEEKMRAADEDAQKESERLKMAKDAELAGMIATAEATKQIAQLSQQASEDRVAALQTERDRLSEIDGARKEQAQQRIKEIDEELHAAQGAAERAFRVQQAAAIAAATMNAAQAYLAFLATFSPLGPFAPAAALAITGPALASQLAVISQQKPPQVLHDGGVMLAPDEFRAGQTIQRQGEARVVLNQRAVERGAVERVRAENTATNRGGSATMVLADAGRVIGAAVMREVQRPESGMARAFGSTSGQVELGRRA